MSSQSDSPLADSAAWDVLQAKTPSGKQSLEGEPGGNLKPPPKPSVPLVNLLYVSAGAGKDVCGGRIGSDNTKFCSMPCLPGTSSCGQYSSHLKKVDLFGHCYYIQTAKPSVCYLEPILMEPPNGYPAEIYDVLTGKRTAEDWADVFNNLQTIEALNPSHQKDILSRVDRKRDIIPTPIKLHRRSLSEEFESKLAKVMEPDSWSEMSAGDLDGAMLGDEVEEITVGHVSKYWDKVIKMTQAQVRRTVDLEGSVKNLLEELDDKIVKVASMIGRPSIVSPAVTLWASVNAHSESLGQVWETLTAFDKTSLDERLVPLSTKIDNVRALVRTKVLPVVQDLFKRMETIGSASGPQTTVLNNDVQAMIEHLHNEVQQLKRQGGMNAEEDAFDGIESIRGLLASCRDDIAVLQEENIKLRSEMNSESLFFGGFYFTSMESIEQFVLVNITSGYYGFCYDFVSMMECYYDRNRGTDVGLAHKHLMGKAGYTDPSSARIDQSFGTVVPMIFGKEEEATNPSKKLSAMTTALIWDADNNRAGIRVNIDKFMSSHQKTVEKQIVCMFGASSVATKLFQALMNDTVIFWNSLSAWISKFERELSSQLGVGSKQKHKAAVWELVCWMIYSMFVEFHNRRADGSAVETETKEGVKKCASVLSGALSAHKFMAELRAADFVRHPIFSATMHEFTLANKASNDALEDLQEKFSKLEVQFKSAQAAMDKNLKKANQQGAAK